MRGLAILLVCSSVILVACTPQRTGPESQSISPTLVVEVAEQEPTAVPVPPYNGNYLPYSESVFDQTKDQQRVLFFHADWCPTCRAADAEFTQNLSSIPENVVIFKTDYDEETELKQKYGVTYQHTFVLVDDGGNEITKWNGGGVDEIIQLNALNTNQN